MSYNNNPYQNNSYNQGPANEAGYNYAQVSVFLRTTDNPRHFSAIRCPGRPGYHGRTGGCREIGRRSQCVEWHIVG